MCHSSRKVFYYLWFWEDSFLKKIAQFFMKNAEKYCVNFIKFFSIFYIRIPSRISNY